MLKATTIYPSWLFPCIANMLLGRCHGAMVPGAPVSWCHGALVPWCSGVMVPWCHGSPVPWCHGDLVLRCHGVPTSQGHHAAPQAPRPPGFTFVSWNPCNTVRGICFMQLYRIYFKLIYVPRSARLCRSNLIGSIREPSSTSCR